MFKLMKKILLYLLAAITLVFIGLIGYLKIALPSIKLEKDLKIEVTKERVERGKYLANAVMACMDCHSRRDWNKFTGPITPGTFGQGGEEFSQKIGLPGYYTSKNITPFGIGDWSDAEVFRAITSGVDKSGKALFPIMPYPSYGKLDREDIYSVIAYLRTLEPISSNIAPSKSDFPMSLIINMIPKEAHFTTRPDKSDKIAFGKYLATAASCNHCHTQQVKGKPKKGFELAGGFEFPLSTGGIIRSANITPDPETGIGNWSEEDFVNRFKAYADSSFVPNAVQHNDYNTLMPWMMYGHMDTDDLKAIYAYLRTLKPVKNKFEGFTKN
jgi:cytochrome c553